MSRTNMIFPCLPLEASSASVAVKFFVFALLMMFSLFLLTLESKFAILTESLRQLVLVHVFEDSIYCEDWKGVFLCNVDIRPWFCQWQLLCLSTFCYRAEQWKVPCNQGKDYHFVLEEHLAIFQGRPHRNSCTILVRVICGCHRILKLCFFRNRPWCFLS